MAGSNQAVNLQGMLTQLSQDIGGFADVQANYGNAIRNMARPDLDMDNVQSMNAYGQWLINNGKIAEGQAVMGQAANLKRKNRALEGEVAISKLASRWHTETDATEKQKISDAISNIAGQTGVSSEAVRTIMLKESLDIREQGRKEDDTDSTIRYRSDSTANDRSRIALERTRIDNNYDVANRELQLGNDRLAEQIRSSLEAEQLAERAQSERERANQAGEGLTGRELSERERSNRAGEGLTRRGLDDTDARYYAGLDQRKSEFNRNYSLDVDRFGEEQRMNDHAINVDTTRLDQSWASLGLEERRVVVAEQLKDNEISFTDFKKIIMGDENNRANQMQPYEIEAKKAGIQVALASAGFTEAQTERALYDLGFEKSVRGLRQDIIENDAELGAANVDLTKARTKGVKAETARTKKDINRIIAETKGIRARTDYQETATDALVAEMKLNEKRFNLAERTQFWNEGIQTAELQLRELAQKSDIALNDAQIENLTSLFESRTFRDRMFAVETMGKGVSQAYKAAYALTFDPLNQTAVDNARMGFYNQYGAGALVDFDAALQEKIKLKQLQVTVMGLQQGLEDKTPPTRATLKAAGFSDDAIDTVINLPATQRNQAILNEATRLLSPDRGGVVTQAHLDVVKDRAEEMFYATFGEDWTFIIPTFNGVWDKEVIDKVQWALAEANAAGRSPLEAVMAGANAMMPYLEQTGGGAVQGLDSLIKSMSGN